MQSQLFHAGDLCPAEPEAFNCLCEVGACEAAASSTPSHCEDIEISYTNSAATVHNGVGGSPWTVVSSTYGSGGSYLSTASKAADCFIPGSELIGIRLLFGVCLPAHPTAPKRI